MDAVKTERNYLMRRRTSLVGIVLATTVVLAACGDDGGGDTAPTKQAVPIVAVLEDDTIVQGGALRIEIFNTDLLRPAFVTVVLDGSFNGNPTSRTLPAEFVEIDDGLLATVDWDALAPILPPGSTVEFAGTVTVLVDDLGGELQGTTNLDDSRLLFVDELIPALTPASRSIIHLNEVSVWEATGLLREGEGVSKVIIEGTFTGADDGLERQLTATVPIELPTGRRDEAGIRWSAFIFGVKPGSFVGTLQPINDHTIGGEIPGTQAPLEVELQPTVVEGFDPQAAGRGQFVNMFGKGFIPSDPMFGQSMFLELSGMFQLTDGEVLDLTGDNVIRLVPDSVGSHDEARIAFRTETALVDGRNSLVGISARPGRFMGTITPVLVDGAATYDGVPYEGTLEVLPTRQYVWVRLLPGFTDSLGDFGLANVEFEIRERIFEVIRRDYAGLSIEFGDAMPTEFVEFSTIEVGGPDPNDAGLFGLDNTAGKDTGNLRLNDYIGGTNAESGELGYYVFGGVFISSFVAFSASAPGSQPEIASARFDEIMSPFWPALGGTPITADEWPDGPRAAEIEMAIHVIGSIIGNTVTHEIGHSLGLSFFEEDYFIEGNRFHNDFPEDGSIMDSGGNRPFEERAEIDGVPAAVFNERNWAYLETIIPAP